jgi:uncharacterized protein YdhG (YjbR/CyaY superfamily)
MASSKATTVDEYLAELPPERRAVVIAVRDVVRKNLPNGYTETMNWGMISYELPLARYPNTYNGKPLGYAALAAQKNYFALYLPLVYQDAKQEARLREEFEKAGKKLDIGKSCVRFKRVEDLELGAIAKVIASTPPDEFIERYEAARGR